MSNIEGMSDAMVAKTAGNLRDVLATTNEESSIQATFFIGTDDSTEWNATTHTCIGFGLAIHGGAARTKDIYVTGKRPQILSAIALPEIAKAQLWR